MDPRIAEYIRENRRRYTREAITQQLVAAGHDPGEIERVWAALDAPDRDDVAGEGFWGRFALILVGVNVAVFLLVGLLTGMFQNLAGGSFIMVILAIAMGIGALIAWGIVALTGPAKLNPRTALMIGAAIPALFALLIGGTCYALISSLGMGSSGPPPVTGAMEVRLEGAVDVTERADVFCHAEGENALFLVAEVPTADGRLLFISINAFGDEPGAPSPSLFIEAPSMDGSSSLAAWGTDVGPPAEEIDWTIGPAAGRVAFHDLPGTDHGDGKAPSVLPPLSGEISWTCEGSAP